MAVDADGIFGKDIFFLVAENPVPPTPNTNLPEDVEFDCCNDFTYKVYANDSGLDYENDKKDFLFVLNTMFGSAEMNLEKFNTESGEWESIATLANDDLGTFHQFGFYINQKNESYIGYLLDFALVLDNSGVGSYRVKCTATLVTSGTVDLYTDVYCLSTFNPDIVDGSVRLEYYRNGFMGDEENDEKVMEYGNLNWYGQTRIPGFFSYENDEGTKETIRYQNGQENWTKDEKTLNWILRTKQLFWNAHKLIKTDILQADNILITDYNSLNFGTFIKKKVKAIPGYKPEFNYLKTKLASVEIKFTNEFNNFKKFRS